MRTQLVTSCVDTVWAVAKLTTSCVAILLRLPLAILYLTREPEVNIGGVGICDMVGYPQPCVINLITTFDAVTAESAIFIPGNSPDTS